MSLDQKRHSIGPAAIVPQSAFLDRYQLIWRLNFRVNIEQHRTAQEELIASNIKTVLLNVMNELPSSADPDYGLYKLEWLCSLVLRFRGTFKEALLPNLRQAHDLISLMISHNEESSDVHNNRPIIVTGNKGRPKMYMFLARFGPTLTKCLLNHSAFSALLVQALLLRTILDVGFPP